MSATMSRAFSMIELVIVVVIIGIIAAIAIPRFEGMTDKARGQRLIADLSTLQKAAELYQAEHLGVNVGKASSGTAVDADTLALRLTGHTDEGGSVAANGIFGPYVRAVPVNTMNDLATIRVDGAAPGAGTHGWRFSTATGNFAADTVFEVTLPDGSVVDHTGLVTGVGSIVKGAKLDALDK